MNGIRSNMNSIRKFSVVRVGNSFGLIDLLKITLNISHHVKAQQFEKMHNTMFARKIRRIWQIKLMIVGAFVFLDCAMRGRGLLLSRFLDADGVPEFLCCAIEQDHGKYLGRKLVEPKNNRTILS